VENPFGVILERNWERSIPAQHRHTKETKDHVMCDWSVAEDGKADHVGSAEARTKNAHQFIQIKTEKRETGMTFTFEYRDSWFFS
jgi:hypothetical protein